MFKKRVLYSKDGRTLVKLPPAYQISEFTIPKSVVNIGNRAFSGCDICNKVILHGGIKKIGYCVFADSSIVSVICHHDGNGNIFVKDGGLYYIVKNKEFKNGLKCLVFYDRDAEHVKIMSDTNIIREFAFQGCKKIKNFSVDLSYKYDCCPEIMEYAFKDCTSLVTFSFPKGVEYVPDGCFENCYELQQIDLPEDLYIVGQSFLKGCEKRVRIVLRTKHDSIISSDYAFDGFNGGITFDIRSRSFNADQYMDFIMDAPDTYYEVGEYGRSVYKAVKGMLFKSLFGIVTKLLRVPSNLECFAIKDETLHIEEIGKYAFINCRHIKYIDISDTVKVITKGMIFGSDELKVVRLPEHVLIQEYDENDRPIITHRKPVDEDNVFSIYRGNTYPITIIGDRVCKERGEKL